MRTGPGQAAEAEPEHRCPSPDRLHSKWVSAGLISETVSRESGTTGTFLQRPGASWLLAGCSFPH